MAEPMRVAFWNAELSRQGPGLLLRDLQRSNDPQIETVLQTTLDLRADVLVLAGFDYDLELRALKIFAGQLAERGLDYPYLFAFAPNAGLATGLDLDNNGRTGEPRDAMGYGRFAGEGGLAILSRRPILTEQARDFSKFLWSDLPQAILPPDMTKEQRAIQRLSSVGHWDVPVEMPDGTTLHLLVWAGSPPVFDGPEDRNGRRNHDETAFWSLFLAGKLPFAAPDGPFVLMGQANMDPAKGDGRRAAVAALLSDPLLQNPLAGPTADYGGKLGALQVDLLLPAASLPVVASGTPWPPAPGGSRHVPIWVDLAGP